MFGGIGLDGRLLIVLPVSDEFVVRRRRGVLGRAPPEKLTAMGCCCAQASVVQVEASRVLVHFRGYVKKWDEWLDKCSKRIQPFGTDKRRRERERQMEASVPRRIGAPQERNRFR